MSKNRLLLISILILLASLASCTVSKNTTSNKNKWLEHQFKSLNYIDTADSKTKVNDLFIDGLVCQMQNHNSAAILCFQDALKYGSKRYQSPKPRPAYPRSRPARSARSAWRRA